MDNYDYENYVGHLVTALENTLESARSIYRETERMVDALPPHSWTGEGMTNYAYDDLLRAEQLVNHARNISQLGAHPSYRRPSDYTVKLLRKATEQYERLTHHLGYVGLRDDDSRKVRRDHAQAFIDGMALVQQYRESVYSEKPRPSKYPGFGRNLIEEYEDPDFHVRLLDGLVECSIEAIEAMAGVVRTSTRLVP